MQDDKKNITPPESNSPSETEEIDAILDVSGKNLDLSLFEGDGVDNSSCLADGLYVYRNVFNLIPKSIGGFGGRLKTVKFFANEINLFDSEFVGLEELECLQVKVSVPGLTGLPLRKLKALKELELWKPPPRPSAFPSLSEIAALKCLTKLTVCHFSIRYLPPEIGCLNKLEYLDLSFNKMRSLPKEISSLNALISLKVANNKLVTLPAGLSSLQRLENLDLSRNRLASLGSLELNSMQNLRYLNLQYNKLLSCQIPAWICCNLEGNGDGGPSDDLSSSAVEMDVLEATIHDDGSVSCNVSSNTSLSMLLASSSNSRCFATRRMGKRWKRRQYLQQRARQERLNHSRNWKVEHPDDVLTNKSAENCRICDQDVITPEVVSDSASGITCLDDECKHSPCGDGGDGNVVDNDKDAEINSNRGLDLGNCSCGDTVRDSVVGECAHHESHSCPTYAPSTSSDHEGSSSEASKPTPKSKRHSDGILDNPKRRKARRSTNHQSNLSCKYNSTSFCSTEDCLSDGFYDAGRDRPFMSLREYERNLDLNSREVILVDREEDEELDAITLSAQALVYRFKQLHGLKQRSNDVADDSLLVASLLALFVSDHFGGSDRSSLLERVRKDVSGSTYSKPFVCTCSTGNRDYVIESNRQNIGSMEDIVFLNICERSLKAIKASRNSIVLPLGSLPFGVCRHRAVLFKYLCDRMDPPVPCELVRGYLDFFPHAWNVILVQKSGSWVRMLVDACHPHDIREVTDPEYFCRYLPLTRLSAPFLARDDPASACYFPSLSTSEEVEKAASSSLILCNVGSVEAVAKVRTLEATEASGDEIRRFECNCLGEVRILGALRGHPSIIEIYGHQISSEWIRASDDKHEHRMLRSAILMEYIKGGSLKCYIKKLSKAGEKHVPVKLSLCIAKSVACALKELHSKHIIHRDIKSENILIDLDVNKEDKKPLVKLCDFDRAVPLRSSLHTCCIAHAGIPPSDTCVGTPRWMAPEVLRTMHKRNIYGLEVDIWSYGCVLLELLTLQAPYFGLPDDEIHDLLQSGKRPPLSDELEELGSLEKPSGSKSEAKDDERDVELEGLKLLVDVYRRCTEAHPDDRPTSEEVYEMLLSKTDTGISN